ncbi:MAG TPA: aminomethyl-transferring glycine dehydrogenase [Bacteroidia bacterium]|nr:aminomethyl-transferring glycine dehydrogenase [Bacteroidia bacterium]
MNSKDFENRHIGIAEKDLHAMLEKIGVSSLDELISQTIPSSIRLKNELNIPDGLSEFQYLKALREIADKNKTFKSYIGQGYYNCIVPGVIQRNIFENPGWYTAYTPYQAEIAQGRLEALLNFQTMIVSLTGLPIANASLLDEATAAAEAMHMFHANHSRENDSASANKFFVDKNCFAQTIEVLQTRSAPLGIELVIGDWKTFTPDQTFFGALIQYPDGNGEVHDYSSWVSAVHNNNVQVAVAADLLSLVLMSPPGEWGADITIGTAQRFGVPLGYGGPHAAFISAREEYKRLMPGRIIGVSVDAKGHRAMRMSLQTREQHIRRDKATSNICTAQVLLAVMSGMYAVYHGADGLKKIAGRIHGLAVQLNSALSKSGFHQLNKNYFDTLFIDAGELIDKIRTIALKEEINFRFVDNRFIGISLDETTDEQDLEKIISVFASAINQDAKNVSVNTNSIPAAFSFPLQRASSILTHSVFNSFHTETEMLRYISRLEKKDLSLNHSMIPLGSCTMKLNATSELVPLSWRHFSSLHPFVPLDQAEGYQQIISELEKYLGEITGFAGVSLQPNSGAQGEYAGLMIIRAYHLSRNESHRNVVLIPQSAHGTNPASAVMAGMKVVVVRCDENGNIDVPDLSEKAKHHKNDLSALMVTYPSTHGVFEESIREVTAIIHQYGGQVYMDGANMNAQVGLTNPAMIGADVCHLNLHKTFAIPHGGGGPGMGPVGVASHLVPFLPSHSFLPKKSSSTTAVSAAPWSSASILLISYGYIRMLGKNGLKQSTIISILNANYLKAKLEKHFPVLYKGKNGRVAHELLLDCRAFKKSGIEVEDIAKRLMDYGFHAPTVSFPVAGTLMIEPTESESVRELDRFCDAMLSIRQEIDEVEKGIADKADNVLKNSPHTVYEVSSDEWNHSYSRQKACFPLPWVKENKFWSPVSRVDNAYGDRNLICTCPEIASYEDLLAAK